MQIRDSQQDVYSMDTFEKLQSLDNSSEPKENGEKAKLTDEQIITRTNEWKNASETFTKEVEKIGDRHYAFYVGRPPEEKLTDPDESTAYVNKLWSSARSVVNFVTAKPAEPVVHLNEDVKAEDKEKNEKIKKSSQHLQKVLLAMYRYVNMQAKNEKVVKHSFIYLIGFYKYGIKDGVIWTDTIIPDRIYIDPYATCMDEVEYIGEKMVKSARQWAEIFPDKKKEILAEVNGDEYTRLTGIEWWTADKRITILEEKIVLENIENPYYDFTDKVEDKEKEASNTRIRNIHNVPKIPYIPFQVDNIGLRMIDDTSAFEQAIPLQKELNDRKRQLSNHAELTGRPRMYTKGMTTTQADSIVNDDGDGSVITLTANQEIGYVQPPAMSPEVLQDLQDTKWDIDETFATSATFRGVDQEGQETARGRELLRSGSEDAQANIARAIERCMQELYTAWLQLIVMYYDTPKIVPIPWVDGADGLKISRDDITASASVMVRAGSTIPDDKLYLSTMAMQLRTGGMLSIKDTLELTGIQNPEAKIRNLAEEQVDMEAISAMKQQELQAQQATAQEAQSIGQEIDMLGAEGEPLPQENAWQNWQTPEKNIMSSAG